MSSINTENKMALIWRVNVIALLDYHRVSKTALGRLIGKNESTIQKNFTGGTNMKHLPSRDTTQLVEKAFKVKKGALSKSTYKPYDTDSELPTKAALAGQAEPQASINIPIPPDKLERILRILNE